MRRLHRKRGDQCLQGAFGRQVRRNDPQHLDARIFQPSMPAPVPLAVFLGRSRSGIPFNHRKRREIRTAHDKIRNPVALSRCTRRMGGQRIGRQKS